MNRRTLLRNISLGSLALVTPSWIIKEVLPKLKPIEHVRHGFLDFDMNHPQVITHLGIKYRLDQMFENGISSNPKKDLFVLTTLENGKQSQEFFEGKPDLFL